MRVRAAEEMYGVVLSMCACKQSVANYRSGCVFCVCVVLLNVVRQNSLMTSYIILFFRSIKLNSEDVCPLCVDSQCAFFGRPNGNRLFFPHTCAVVQYVRQSKHIQFRDVHDHVERLSSSFRPNEPGPFKHILHITRLLSHS